MVKPLVDDDIVQLAKRILTLSLPAQTAEQAQWRLAKIQDAAKALLPRAEQQMSLLMHLQSTEVLIARQEPYL